MISSINIKGYRLLDEFTADFKPLTIVIGANAVGKSTLLDCLQFIAQCVEFPLDTALGWHFGITSMLNAAVEKKEMSWQIVLKKPSNSIWKSLPLDENESLIYKVVLNIDNQGSAKPTYELLCKKDPAEGYSEPLKFLEATPFRKNIFDFKTHHLIPFDQSISNIDDSTGKITTENENPIIIKHTQEQQLMLSQIRFFNDHPIPSSARYLLATMAFYPGFDVTRFSNLRTKAAEIKASTILNQNGDNLGTALHEILTRFDFRSEANDIRDFLKAAYPTFEEIHCDTTLGVPPQVLVRIREKSMKRSMEIWELSDGMLRFLCLATALLNPQPPPFIAIDEPEMGLHPRLLPIIADMIKAASEKTQVLVTTHNPDLLNHFRIEDVAVMSRGEKYKAKWYRPSNRKTLVEMLNDVSGDSLGDLHRSGELEGLE